MKTTCEECKATNTECKRCKRNRINREKNEALKSLGLKKVRGAMGGTYWE